MAIHSGDIYGAWNLDESSGNAVDSSGAGNTLTNNNSMTYGTGKINNGAVISSTGPKYLSITDASQNGLDLGTNWSFSLWVKFSSVASAAFIAKAVQTGNQRSYQFGYTGSNQFELRVNHTNGSSGSTVVTDWTWTPSSGTWYHIAVTGDNNGAFSFYLNGTLVSTQTYFTDLTPFNSTAPFEVGATSDGGTFSPLNGTMDIIICWNGYTLTQTDVDGLYNGGAGIQYPFSVPTNGGFLSMFM